MNAEEVQANRVRLATMNKEDQAIQAQLETLNASSAEIAGRVEVLEAEIAEFVRVRKEDLQRLIANRNSMQRERQILLEKRLADKREYGVLYEQTGRAEQALAAEDDTE